MGATRAVTQAAASGTPLPWGPKIFRVRDGAAQVTQLQTRYGMTGTVQTQEQGGAGGAQPPLKCLTHLNAALHCKDQAAISEMVEQEQWGAEGAQPPPNCSHYIGYNFNLQCRLQRRLRPIFCDP